MEGMAINKLPATVSWYFDVHHLQYSYSKCSTFVENLGVVLKVIEAEIEALYSEKKQLKNSSKIFRRIWI